MLKDSHGYLWLGTANGLKRYDPAFTVTYLKEKGNNNSLIHNNVESLCEDRQGRIWVGTTEGVCYFDRKTNKFTRIVEVNKPDYACRNIICDSRGDIWFTIRDGGLYKFDTQTNKLSNFRHNYSDLKTLTHNRISKNGLLEDPSKKGLWIACQDKLNFFDFSTQKVYNVNHNPLNIPILNNSDVTALTLENNLLVYSDNTDGKICWYNTRLNKIEKTFKVIDINGVSYTNFFKIYFDSNHDLWITDIDKKSFYVDAKLTKSIPLEYEKGNKNSFTAYCFTDVLQEENGTLWFSTVNGISVINGIALKNPNGQLFNIYDFTKDKFIEYPEDGIIDFVEDSKDNTWWFITAKNRLLNYNKASDKFKEYKIPFNPNAKQYDLPAAVREYQNKILIIKHRNIYSFDKTTYQFQEIKVGKELNLTDYFGMENCRLLGDSLWVFTKSNSRLDVYNYHLVKKKWSVYPVIYRKNTVKLNPTRDIFVAHTLVTKKGEFWLAIHSGGLAKYNHQLKAFEVIKTKQDVDFTKIGYTGFDEDKNGNIWISSYNIIKFNPQTYDFQPILDCHVNGSMLIDKNDNISMATFDEFMFYNINSKEEFSFIIGSNVIFESWGNNLYKLKNNQLLSRNRKGVVLINFSDFKIQSSNDKLYLTRLSTADTVIHLHENNLTINLKSNQNSLSFGYGVLLPPETVLYEYYYKLEGFDKDWQPDKRQSGYAIYGNLDGGDYVFRVKAKDANGKFLKEQQIFISIATPFYKTTWFKILGFLIAAGLILGFIRFRANQRKKIYHLQLQSTRLAKDKTEIQYQNLINHLNPHFLFNSLTSLNSLIITEPKQASKFLQKLSAIYRYILQSKDKETVTIEHELNFVKNYIELQKSRFEDGLIFEVNVEDEYLINGIVPVTLQNLFENAIKHNIIEDSNPLKISVLVDGDFLVVKNNLQRKKFVETSNKQGLESLKKLYSYLTTKPFETLETTDEFIVKIPFI